MVLGYQERAPGGAIQVWYSGQREVLRIQNGRLAGAVGLTVEWHNVKIPSLPDWSDLAKATGEYRWIRSRDEMPGYRFGLQDQLSLVRAEPPTRSDLQGIDPRDLNWFEERTQPVGSGSDRHQAGTLPVARYAVDIRGTNATVVYGEQCIAPDLCFSWQRWPAKPDEAGKPR